MIDNVSFNVKIPRDIKNKLLDIVNERKKEGKSDTLKTVALELWEKALALPEYQEVDPYEKLFNETMYKVAENNGMLAKSEQDKKHNTSTPKDNEPTP